MPANGDPPSVVPPPKYKPLNDDSKDAWIAKRARVLKPRLGPKAQAEAENMWQLEMEN